MAKRFRYRGRSAHGHPVGGDIEGVSVDGVAAELLAKGITPIDISEARARSDLQVRFVRWWHQRQITLLDLIMFSRQMYSLTRAGIPIIRTLESVSDSNRSVELKRVLAEIAGRLQAGQSLAASMQHYPMIFSSLYVSIVHVGETVGRMDEAFHQLAQYLELEEDTRKRIASASRYPVFVVISIFVAMIIINIWVIPPFGKLFESFGSDLPWATKILVESSAFSIEYWPHGLAVMLVLIGAGRQFVNTPKGRLWFDRLKLRVPITGSIQERALLARFARTLAVTLSAGLPVTQALTVVSRAVDNRYVGEKVLKILDSVERGETLTNSARDSGLFPPLVLQMLSIGEETGAVDEMLLQVAEFYEGEVDYDLKKISESIEPILIVFVGGMVLLLALGIYLPMWEMATASRGS